MTYMWGADLELDPLLRLCERSGVDGLELRTTHAHGVEPTLSRARREEVRARFESSSVTLVGLVSDERFDSPDPERLRAAIGATRRFLQLSHDVGGSGVKVKPNDLPEGVPVEATIEQIARSLRELGPFAEDLGQEIRLEAHGACAPLPRMRSILEAADHRAVRLCWNSNAVDLEGAGLEANFELVREWFGHTLHVRRLDFEGYPVRELFALLERSEYDGWVLLEQGGEVPKELGAALTEQRALFERFLPAR